ncbi:hypothetical protein GWO43_00205 [candidate division KSB1 bacterium]|nr:hypothetical protein [candidate division KSB1 bacterium]NIR68491.1 hypothetical protein [candidate division KSB1 bacterium]NIS22505.1 hypothetical protein [candidate division KSB1 bacterium]NIT69349.1 hypothetical protein [candidate division KSB1 bacterium]NIU23010.1 hypothetical protein [candidate division KSB1 bacterium]
MAEPKTTTKKTGSREQTKTAPAVQTTKTSRDDGKPFFDKVGDVAQKGVELSKRGAQKLFHFTGSATKLSKLKVEIHNLETQCEKQYLEAGKKLWQMYKDGKLGELKSKFDPEFQKVEGFKKQITEKEKESEKISLVE